MTTGPRPFTGGCRRRVGRRLSLTHPGPGIRGPGEVAPDRAPFPNGTGPAGGTPVSADPPGPGSPTGRLARLVRGRPQDPPWVRPALLALLVGTGFLYLWGLGASGWGNSFYAAAVQAGTKSWKAFFFGSSDASNFITVDKPPASLWVMELSARIFGVNSWSILVPQALEGVATVGLLFVTVRRWFTPGAALLAGAVVALTPVATLMFRFNNPDALLTLLLTGAAYATVRAIEDGRTRWMVLAGSLVGFGFITKMLQAIILLPVLALVYLLAGPPKLGRRIVQAGRRRRGHWSWRRGWWVAAVQLTPAASRPYIGGSTDNNLLNLIFGYNGFGRLTGNETGSVGGGRRDGGQHLGPDRMEPPLPPRDGWADLLADPRGPDRAGGRSVDDPSGATDRPGPRRHADLRRLAAPHRRHLQLRPRHHPPLLHGRPGPGHRRPGGDGGIHLWRRRQEVLPRVALAAAIVATIAWAFVIFGWSPHWYPALRWVILSSGWLAALGIAVTPRARGVLAAGLAGFGFASVIAGPAAYSLTHGGHAPQRSHPLGRSRRSGGAGSAARVVRRAGRALGRQRHHPAPRFTLAQRHKLPNGLRIPGSFFRQRPRRRGGLGGRRAGPGRHRRWAARAASTAGGVRGFRARRAVRRGGGVRGAGPAGACSTRPRRASN